MKGSFQFREPSKGKNLEWVKQHLPCIGLFNPPIFGMKSLSHMCLVRLSPEIFCFIVSKGKKSPIFPRMGRGNCPKCEIGHKYIICTLTYIYNVYLLPRSRYKIFPSPQKFPSFPFLVKNKNKNKKQLSIPHFKRIIIRRLLSP